MNAKRQAGIALAAGLTILVLGLPALLTGCEKRTKTVYYHDRDRGPNRVYRRDVRRRPPVYYQPPRKPRPEPYRDDRRDDHRDGRDRDRDRDRDYRDDNDNRDDRDHQGDRDRQDDRGRNNDRDDQRYDKQPRD